MQELDVMILEHWQNEAACAGADLDHFFHPDAEDMTEDGQPVSRQLIGQTRRETAERALLTKVRFCSVCPVRLKCATFGMDQEYGIFGGFYQSERERQKRGEWRAPKPRTLSPKRVQEAVSLCRDGLSLEDIATKMQIGRAAVQDYLNMAWADYLATQSEVVPTA